MAGARDMQGRCLMKMAGLWSRPGGAMKTPCGFCGFHPLPSGLRVTSISRRRCDTYNLQKEACIFGILHQYRVEKSMYLFSEVLRLPFLLDEILEILVDILNIHVSRQQLSADNIKRIIRYLPIYHQLTPCLFRRIKDVL